MRILSPYDTTYGKMINTERVRVALTKYLAMAKNTNLNYEFEQGTTRIVFIVGANQEEKDLPIWEHPLVFTDLNKETVVAMDLRSYVRKVNDYPMNLADIAKDINTLNFLALRTIVTADYIDGNVGKFRNIYNNLASAFGLFIGSMVGALVGITPDEKVALEIGLAYYINTMYHEDVEGAMPGIIARLHTTRYSLPVGKRFIDNVIENIPKQVDDVDAIEGIVRATIQPEKAEIVNINAIINMIANVWYGPGGSETVIMSLEHLPTWISLVTTNITNRSYKRTRFATILDKGANRIKVKEIEKVMELYFKEKDNAI